ncbi:hypothetical protein ABTY61_12100 [Kitasatospora sp. NPDC096128]|uniref:hypothetical protein n=1 Tax=Kitasatospora sp. NPDC096128 TaxID=3155547 RepID=UPI0033238933
MLVQPDDLADGTRIRSMIQLLIISLPEAGGRSRALRLASSDPGVKSPSVSD